jgi:hypothetical protein
MKHERCSLGQIGDRQIVDLPSTIPEDDPAGLWWLQNLLLDWAEQLLGKREQSKKIYQPKFHENGPYLINTPSLDGAFAVLGPGSARYWPSVVYEMAHETVHLLNPIAGYTNYFEEGIAVEFSIFAQRMFGVLNIQKPVSGSYWEALELVRSLPDGTFHSAHRVREAYVSLGSVTFEQLLILFPENDPEKLRSLSELCIGR